MAQITQLKAKLAQKDTVHKQELAQLAKGVVFMYKPQIALLKTQLANKQAELRDAVLSLQEQNQTITDLREEIQEYQETLDTRVRQEEEDNAGVDRWRVTRDPRRRLYAEHLAASSESFVGQEALVNTAQEHVISPSKLAEMYETMRAVSQQNASYEVSYHAAIAQKSLAEQEVYGLRAALAKQHQYRARTEEENFALRVELLAAHQRAIPALSLPTTSTRRLSIPATTTLDPATSTLEPATTEDVLSSAVIHSTPVMPTLAGSAETSQPTTHPRS